MFITTVVGLGRLYWVDVGGDVGGNVGVYGCVKWVVVVLTKPDCV